MAITQPFVDQSGCIFYGNSRDYYLSISIKKCRFRALFDILGPKKGVALIQYLHYTYIILYNLLHNFVLNCFQPQHSSVLIYPTPRLLYSIMKIGTTNFIIFNNCLATGAHTDNGSWCNAIEVVNAKCLPPNEQ